MLNCLKTIPLTRISENDNQRYLTCDRDVLIDAYERVSLANGCKAPRKYMKKKVDKFIRKNDGVPVETIYLDVFKEAIPVKGKFKFPNQLSI